MGPPGKFGRSGNARALTGKRERCGHWLGGVVVVFSVACGGYGWASQATLAEAPKEVRELAEDNAVGFLNDLSSRRRTTTFFTNPQPVFAGVQESFVNTSTGALTFLVRDLVRIGGMPIVLGRVYDSTLDEGADFGPGWKLTVVEEIRQEGSQLHFADASNGVHRLDVTGGSVTPTSPATAPVVSGSTRTTGGEAGVVVLESADGMLRRFKQDGEVWRLVHVRHGRGWVRLDWRRGALVEVTSDAGWVRISHRDDGRIASIVDDLGRTVAYSYDADGRLVGVSDLAGGQWHMGYAAAGRLSSITDPRSKVVLAAAWTDARVRRIRVLHETTDFSYTDTATTATNLLGWATVYRRDDSGITTSITDRTGATTEIAFDSQHRPATVTRDGATVARVGYDGEGHLQSLWQPAGETAFTTNNRGEVTVATGAWTARYRYDQRRVVHASDSGGVRDYRYDRDGTPAGVTVDGVDTALRTNADGTLAGMSRDGRVLAAYSYAAGGRVSLIDYGGDMTATFVYDARGLRTSGSYAYGSDNRIDAEMSYDAAANLTRIERGIAGGEATEQTYVVGDYNEVLQVRSDDDQDRERPDLSFEYDAAGRMQRATLGSRTATVEYDALDRTTRLVVDGDTVLEHAYGPDDGDAATRQDLRTGGVLVAEPLSAVFGTMESIVYARPRSAEFGIVAYSPSRKTFEVRADALAADALLLASLHARMVPLGGQEPNAAPFGHDKPSNSLFIPPEFKAVNCQLCDSSIHSVELSVEPAGTHCPTNYTATVDGSCAIVPPWDSPIVFPIVLPWFHTTDFGDGSSAREMTWDETVSGSHKYLLAREYTMSHVVLCPCPSAFAVGRDSVTFEVPGGSESCRVPPPQCRVDISIDPTAPVISVVPRMPTITATASNVWPSDATVSWTAQIAFTAPSTTCSGGPRFDSPTVSGTGTTFSPTFDGLYGGELTVTATCSAPGYASATARHSATVNGTQPTTWAIVAEIGTVGSPFEGPDLRRIACHESPGLKQFKESVGPPLFGSSGDVGIMQICKKRTVSDLWNWRDNIRRGRDELENIRDYSATSWLEVMVDDGATPYTDLMWRQEAIHRYNAGDGGSLNAYWEWLGGRWVPVRRGGALGYVEAVLNKSANCL